MPSQSTLNTEEKNKVKAAIPASSNKILFASLARIYYAHPQPNEWSYSGLQGALAIVKDNSKNTHVFRLVDLDGTRGVIWEHELYNTFEYNQTELSFIRFPPMFECMIGFVFADEREAKTFWKKVTSKKDSKGSERPYVSQRAAISLYTLQPNPPPRRRKRRARAARSIYL
ncbi:hypothetical protein C8R46DRAFT_1152471 [Mycena filopes]|nr:hypothetical protein C8R46DRAFT_1152471 [Mycena filopes]